MTKTRLLSVFVLVTAAAIFGFGQANGVDRLVRQCLAAHTKDRVMDTCMQAYQAAHLTDMERGIVAFRLANLQEEQRSWDDADAYYTEAIRLYPQMKDAFYKRGWLRHQHLDDNEGAILDFTSYIATGGRATSGLISRAGAYREGDQFARAEADLQAAAAIDPDNRWLLREQAELLQEQDDDAAALVVLDRAVELHPSILSLWRERSWVKRKLGDYNGALADIGQVIGADPNAMWPWYQRGWLNVRLQNYSQALTALQTAVEKDPTYRPAQREMNRLMDTIGDKLSNDPARLSAFANAGLVNAPSDTALLFLRANGQMGEGKFIGAIRDIDQVIAASDYPQIFIFARSAIYLTAQQFDLALADLELLTRDPTAQDEAINEIATRSQALIEEGKHDEAASLDADVGALASLYKTALQARVVLTVSLNDWPGALEAVDLLIAHDPDDSSQWIRRGAVMERLNRLEEALESYSAAIRLVELDAADLGSDDDARANAHLRRGTLLQSQRRATQAADDFATALKIGGAPLVQAFQQKMQNAGHYAGAIDGIYDTATETALRRCADDPAC